MKTSSTFSSFTIFSRGNFRLLFLGGIAVCILSAAMQSSAQQQQFPLLPLTGPSPSSSLLTSTISPGTEFLFGLERKFAAAVAEGGGPAFASFFDDDGMTLANRQLPVVGKSAIAAHATWSPASYQLTWTPEGGELSPGGDMGYTWGHYEGKSIGQSGNNAVQTGRYVTVWKKEPDGTWKVLMDSSNEDPPQAECKCSVDGTQ